MFWCIVLAGQNSASKSDDTIFWLILSLGAGVIATRGLWALDAERDGGTLELLRLTALSSWGVVAGKWVALMAQLALFLASLLPYGVMRYYIGLLDTGNDARNFIFATGMGMVFGALSVCLSCLHRWLAWTVWGGVLAMWVLGIRKFAYTGSWEMLTGLVFIAGIIAALFLAMGASAFASAAENQAVRKRVLLWMLFLPMAAALWLDWKAGNRRMENLGVAFSVLSGAALLVCADALAAQDVTTPHALRGFIRRGKAGAVAALVFAPNRAAAFFFTVLTWLGVMAAFFSIFLLEHHLSGNTTKQSATYAVAVSCPLALLLLSAGLASLAPRRLEHRFGVRFSVCLTILACWGVACTVLYHSLEEPGRALWYYLGFVSPAGCFLSLVDKGPSFLLKNTFISVVVCAYFGLALALLAFPLLRELKKLRHLLRGERTDLLL
ncbi:MAG: hypothetical protein LBV54_02200 [Puniceicoccales bacterium]|jgi:hypothetical protein|nr:hypothetical protein [Puniceicoccales bacterium]